jgi:hypothetical protein
MLGGATARDPSVCFPAKASTAGCMASGCERGGGTTPAGKKVARTPANAVRRPVGNSGTKVRAARLADSEVRLRQRRVLLQKITARRPDRGDAKRGGERVAVFASRTKRRTAKGRARV